MTLVLLAVAVAALFGVLGTAKILAVPPLPSMATHLGFTVPAYRRIGGLELAGAAGVLLGLWLPWLGLAAAAGLLVLLAGAVISHLRAGDTVIRLLIPLVSAVMVIGYVAAQ